MNATMRCAEVQEYLADRLAGSLSDRLSGTVHSLVRIHMLSCQECCEELEDFQEMQTVLRTIPVEPCDSAAMRARFDLLMGAKEATEANGIRLPAIRFWPLPRTLKIIISTIAAFVVLASAFLAIRQFRASLPVEQVALAPVQPPIPEAVPAAASETTSVSGRVLMEDGSDVSDPLPLGEIVLTPTARSNDDSAIVVNVDNAGKFSQSIATDEYRFRIAVFSQNYIIRSISSGSTDLLNENLKASGESPVAVEIRVARRIDSGIGKVLGTVVDAATNAPSPADRVALCCFTSGPADRVSAPVRIDGTFEFVGIPSAVYTAEVRGSGNLDVANPTVRVTSAGVTGLKLFTAAQLVPVDIHVRLDTGERLPYMPNTAIVFTGATGMFRVTASPVVGNLFRASLPINSAYIVAVSNTAAGYSVQSVTDGSKTDLMHGGFFSTTSNPAGPPLINVTLTKN